MKETCWVFLGGPIRGLLPSDNERPSYVVCADSGARHAVELGVVPDIIVGDFDSLTPHELQRFDPARTIIERHPAEKDLSDCELALTRIPQQRFEAVHFFGVSGGRQDFAINNIQVITNWRVQKGAAVQYCTLQNEGEIGHVLRPGMNSLSLHQGVRVSLLALSESVLGVTTTGLGWPLTAEEIDANASRTISNRAIEPIVTITYRSGKLIAFVAESCENLC